MTKETILINGIILFYIIQRISEMLISSNNEKWLKLNCGAVEVDPSEGLRMKLFHSLWFVSLIVESNFKKEFFPDIASLLIYVVLGICLGIRFYSMEKLKQFWTIKIFSLNRQILYTQGLYKYLRHPNYLVVILEFIFLPLLFKSYFTMIVFSLINLYIVFKRIELEEGVLMSHSDYAEKFLGIKKLFPFFAFALFVSLSNTLYANELSYQFKSYKEASTADTYIKFNGESTKLGFITTGFDGYAKTIRGTYQLSDDNVKSVELVVETGSLDTDLGARNSKMVNEILSMDKFPNIYVRVAGPVHLTVGEQTVVMIFKVKEKEVSKEVKINLSKKETRWIIQGSLSLGIKELNLPDPSIAIAKVRDSFDLRFSIGL